ncbi:Hemolysin-type calcium-binding region:RTX N-terminal domain [Prochlorococcus sp. MIT 0701]|nr:Hemolysin-type calcium-binding region:RTX N-terminal domain [Prochlorococcus sp. MIT 0701]
MIRIIHPVGLDPITGTIETQAEEYSIATAGGATDAIINSSDDAIATLTTLGGTNAMDTSGAIEAVTIPTTTSETTTSTTSPTSTTSEATSSTDIVTAAIATAVD